MSVDTAYQAIIDNGVKTVVALPDSLLAPLCSRIRTGQAVDYIQVTHESTAVGIAAGLSLTGIKTLVLMENSGLRSACETLGRFHLAHHLFCCFLISNRGEFGERNWWGINHGETMPTLLHLLRIHSHPVINGSALKPALAWAFDTLHSGQCSVALIATRTFGEDILK